MSSTWGLPSGQWLVGSGWLLISREEPKVQKGEDMMEILDEIIILLYSFLDIVLPRLT
jgi:hypothetical protein